MAHVPVEELLKRCGSVYKLVILAAVRAKEIAEGSPPLVAETDSQKASSIALDEILQGRVLYKTEEPAAGTGKKGRATKAKERKRAT